MRSRTLIPAIAAVISLFALVPSSALAHKHPNPSGRCIVSMQVAPRQIAAGDPVVIFGRLRCVNRASAAGQQVILYHHLTGLSGFTPVESATTDAHGFYEFGRADGVVETNRSFFVRSHGARSATKRIRVAAQVTLSGSAEGALLTGYPNRVTFTGAVSPADVGARVILQRQNALTGNQWRRIDSGVVESTGDFTITHTFIVPGDANLRVLVRSQGRNVTSESNILADTVSQAQNPELTIQASADPISSGEAVTISGKLAVGGEGRSLTLMAHTARQPGFVAVVQTTGNSAGEYSFPAQLPANSTFYRVDAGQLVCPPNAVCPAIAFRPVSSAVLYEGVKDVLTAQASPTTVQAGQSVTFSGTVSPDQTGHVIYLERQNARGPGFHVVQLAFVGAGSSYTIVHRFYDAGTKLLRVYIPGGPDNQGAASQPFTIQVNPALASTLMPEVPENTTVPPEGQS
jgi:phage protein U